jgi:hypothetical protein
MGERRGAYRVLMWKPEGNRPLSRPRRRWENNIKIDLKEFDREGVNWIDLDQGTGRLAGSCERGNETSGSIKCEEFFELLKN